jgi:hypothetical protein
VGVRSAPRLRSACRSHTTQLILDTLERPKTTSTPLQNPVTLHTLNDLRAASGQYPIAAWGDEQEQAAASLIQSAIPAYEPFWQTFVLPFRESSGVWLRGDLSYSHEAVCIHNYSAFRAVRRSFALLERARTAKSNGEVGSDLFYDYCLWMVVITDRVEQLAGSFYFYLFNSADTKRRELKNWDKHADKLANAISLDLLKPFETSAKRLKFYRNNIAHGAKFPGGKDRVPRDSTLLYWSEFAKVAMKDQKAWLAQTIDRLDLMEDLWKELIPTVDSFWFHVLDRATTLRGTQPLPDQSKAQLSHKTVTVSGKAGATLHPSDLSLFKPPSSGSTYPPGMP